MSLWPGAFTAQPVGPEFATEGAAEYGTVTNVNH